MEHRDLQLNTRAVSLAQAYSKAGYTTAYIGKWHLDGSGRSAYIPRERRQGFEYWKVLECTHDYNHSEYYAGDDPSKRVWPGYDAVAQTDDAVEYLESRAEDHKPFALILCPCPFGQWTRRGGGQEYRGVRTRRYTYVRNLKGPWLLYDNKNDPFQQNNLVDDPAVSVLQTRLDRQLQALLSRTGDRFLSGPELVLKCGYRVDGNETVAYSNPAFHGQVSVCCRDT